jgi:dUTP pyrophosphatase
MESINVAIVLMNEDAKIPQFAHDGDSGADVFSCEEVIIGPEQRAKVHTGIKIALPMGWEAQVRSKSGIAANAGVMVLNSPGTVDGPYRGEICVILHNTSHRTYVVEKGSKIAQLVFKPVYGAVFNQVETLDETDRGEGGFGSTGLKEEAVNDNSK